MEWENQMLETHLLAMEVLEFKFLQRLEIQNQLLDSLVHLELIGLLVVEEEEDTILQQEMELVVQVHQVADHMQEQAMALYRIPLEIML